LDLINKHTANENLNIREVKLLGISTAYIDGKSTSQYFPKASSYKTLK